ncbi:hypothetical protein KI387_001786, partial [Taxus chinensis]
IIRVRKKLKRSHHSEDVLLKDLLEAAGLLSMVRQSNYESLISAMHSLISHLSRPKFLRHADPEVRLVVTTCMSEIMRITVPKQPYSNSIMREVFHLVVGSFQDKEKFSVACDLFKRVAENCEGKLRPHLVEAHMEVNSDDSDFDSYDTNIEHVVDKHEHEEKSNVREVVQQLHETLKGQEERRADNIIMERYKNSYVNCFYTSPLPNFLPQEEEIMESFYIPLVTNYMEDIKTLRDRTTISYFDMSGDSSHKQAYGNMKASSKGKEVMDYSEFDLANENDEVVDKYGKVGSALKKDVSHLVDSLIASHQWETQYLAIHFGEFKTQVVIMKAFRNKGITWTTYYMVRNSLSVLVQ